MRETYSHNPRPFGGPISFVLKEGRLTVDSGRKVREVQLGAAEIVRMTYEPGRLGRKAFRTKVHLKDGKSFTYTSLDWKSLVEAQEMTSEYKAFTQALCEAIRQANPEARFVAGKPWWLWCVTFIIAIASLLAMAVMIWRAFEMGMSGVALMGALFALVGIWQIEPMIRLNKPRAFSPGEPPSELLPKAS